MDKIRLDKFLADSGFWSRKEAKELLRQGRVRRNNEVEKNAAAKIDPQNESIFVDGNLLQWSKFHYVMLYKPENVLTATEDRYQKTVLDLLPKEYSNLFPVGRLDKDTTGLLLLTDDGELAHQLLSPKKHVDKVYLAQIDGDVNAEDIAAFHQGITLGDGTVCLPAKLEPLGQGLCQVTLREGKFHQVKRMLAQRGKPVIKLKRLSMGGLSLDIGMKPGDFRLLTQEEVLILKNQ